MDALAREIRTGLRQLLCNPSFSVVAVAVLALGIGASSAYSRSLSVVLRGRGDARTLAYRLEAFSSPVY